MIITLALLLSGMSCSQSGTAQEQAGEAVRTVNVQVQEIVPRDFSSYLRLVGNVEAASDVRLSAEASGRIITYYVSKGDEVGEGDLLAKIDDARLQRERERLQALTEQARDRYERQRRIWEEDSVGSEIEYLNARYAYQQNQAALEALQIQIDNTEVRAPFNAVVEEIITEQGEMASPGTQLMRLIASDQIKINAGVPARYSNVVNVGDSVSIWFNTQDEDTVRSAINFVGESINQQNRTFEIEVTLPVNGHQYKTGMIANIRLRTLYRPNAVVLSEEFVYESLDRDVVYIAGEDSAGNMIAIQQPVDLGPTYMSDVVAESGLVPGMRLLTVGSAFLQDSTRINIVPELQQQYSGVTQ